MRTQALLDAATVESLLTAAVAAPSIHNTQPWRFRLDADSQVLEVHSAPERTLPLTDPMHRAQYLSVGAAVFNLRLAAVHHGWRPEVKLLPDPHEPGLLAAVRLIGPLGEDDQPSDPGLYEAIARRHSSRMPFTGRPVPEPIVAEMAAAAHAADARLHIPDIAGTRRLLRLTAAAELRNRAHPSRTAETLTWVTAPGSDASYGVPVTALGPPDAAGRMPMRDFTSALPAVRRPALRFERHVQLALLWTPHDRREDWLRAGQALQYVLLTATVHGLRTSLLHQAMEWPDLRAATALPRPKRCHPQLLIRFGYGPEGARTPRGPGHSAARPAGPPATDPQTGSRLRSLTALRPEAHGGRAGGNPYCAGASGSSVARSVSCPW
ncbi:nitroreductase family protein [Streptomyces phaeoluteigriseus]|uniref:Nitroreductase family protein n=1 Tax=Streptomyces phaeoluteigriseus TaxID=114686 RepID=A0ABY4ZAK1_9ACTN|nr:nitroreductase family protein [Streptomyces phaeoluteigriseus]USQ85996.1 nitroreductase family protein [Streptomyces phaeoluteigriseus]